MSEIVSLKKIRDEWPNSVEMAQIRRILCKSDKHIWMVPWSKVLPRLRGLNSATASILKRVPNMKLFRMLREAKDHIIIKEFL